MMHLQRKESKGTLVVAVLVALALMSLVWGSSAARADPSTAPWTSGITVAGSATGNFNGYDRVLADNQGNVYVFFESSTGFNQANVSVTKYNVASPSSPALVFTRSVNNGDMSLLYGSFISAAVDHTGNLYCAWTRSGAYTVGHGAEVFVSMSADGGNSWAQVTQASAPSSYGDNADPSIAINPVDGSVWLAWDQFWGGSFNVTISHSVNQGVTFSGFTNITNQGGSLTVWPQLGIDSHARMYVLFENATSATGVPYTLYWTWSDNGADWAAPQLMPSKLTAAYTPTLVVDASDHVHVAWYDWRKAPSLDNTVHYRMSADGGATWTADLPVSQGTILAGNYPGVAVHGKTVIVLWHSGSGGTPGIGYAVSLDGGLTFHPEQFSTTVVDTSSPIGLAADQNDAFYATYTQSTTPVSVGLKVWVGPPSTPVITSVAPATSQLTVSWSLVPEQNVAEYLVFRSTDGVNFQAVATVGPSTTSYVDTGLANGTYWYEVEAVNTVGVASLPSASWSGSLGPTVAQLQAEITALQAQLSLANANLANVQTQLNAIKAQLTTIQGNTSALQTQLNDLQNQLNNLQTTQTITYANLAFEVIVVVLLILVLLNQMRKPKSPQLMMAEPVQAPRKPEDDL
jgi:hypothetical protein